MIVFLPNAHSKDLNQTCQKVLRLLADPGGWKIGKTKVHWNLRLRPPLLRPVFKNTKSFQVKSLYLKPLVRDHFSQATVTTSRAKKDDLFLCPLYVKFE